MTIMADVGILSKIAGFHDVADVVVVGLGAAGAAAAIEAHDAGADVLVLERASGGGGASQYSSGIFYIGGGTWLQKQHGFEDDPDNMYAYLKALARCPDEEKIRLFCDHSVAHLAWIEAQIGKLNPGYQPMKEMELSTSDGLSWTGHEHTWPYRDVARPAPRGHAVPMPESRVYSLKEGRGGGSRLMNGLIARMKEKGIRIVCDARVNQLIIDDRGRVVGVRYRKFDEDRFAEALGGVVLSTGGFGMNREMLAQYCRILDDDAYVIVGSPNNDGSGHQLGMSVGAATMHMNTAVVSSSFYPPNELMKGVLINKYGRRYVAEDSYHGRTAYCTVMQPEARAWLIVDNSIFQRPQVEHRIVDAWATIAEMEADLGVPSGMLQATMARYNADAIDGVDSEFHKEAKSLQPLLNPPFGALDCSLGSRSYWGFTLGGLKTTADSEVMDDVHRSIPGLYAAGATAWNLAQGDSYYSSGMCLSESTYFGRRAGRHAARSAQSLR